MVVNRDRAPLDLAERQEIALLACPRWALGIPVPAGLGTRWPDDPRALESRERAPHCHRRQPRPLHDLTDRPRAIGESLKDARLHRVHVATWREPLLRSAIPLRYRFTRQAGCEGEVDTTGGTDNQTLWHEAA